MDTDLADLATTDDWRPLLSDTEARLVDHAARGEPLDLRDRDSVGDDVPHADEWDHNRVVRGRVVEALLLQERDDWPLHHRGVLLGGARIDGEVYLGFGTVNVPLGFLSCVFEQPVSMHDAVLRTLAMPGTRLPGLVADRVDVIGSVFLGEGFTATGQVRLLGAKIGGNLSCTSGSFTNPDGDALSADGVDVTGSVFLGEGFTATGQVRLLGAKIGGNLDCTSGSFTNPDGNALSADRLNTTGSVFLGEGFTATGQVRLVGAKIGGNLDCTSGSFINLDGDALSADGVDVTGSVFLGEGFTATGQVRLLGAKIGGDLDCVGGSFRNPDGDALSADGVDVTGSVHLGEGFVATGQVRLLGAKIGGNLDCTSGSLTNPDGDALLADRLDTTGSVFLGEGFAATGQVRLLGAKIGGNLSCTSGSFTNPDGNAWSADGVDVTGNVDLRVGFAATGQVRLLGAKIGGNLDCTSGSFTNPDGNALSADGVDVTGNVFLRSGFAATGQVRLLGAKIGRDLDCTSGSFTNPDGDALSADGVDVTGNVFLSGEFAATGVVSLLIAKVGGSLQWTGSADGVVDLQGASVGPLLDDVQAWPDGWRGDGFSYRDFAGDASVDVDRRLAWLKRQDGGFRPGPYSQLAEVYRRRGNPEATRRVLIAREQLRTGDLRGWRRPVRRTWGVLSAYGYQPCRAIVGLLLLIVVSGVVFWRADALGGMAPLVADSKRVTFFPLVYAADLAVPLIDLRQAGDYQPSVVLAQVWMWATIGIGWFLSGAFLAAVTGIFKPDE